MSVATSSLSSKDLPQKPEELEQPPTVQTDAEVIRHSVMVQLQQLHLFIFCQFASKIASNVFQLSQGLLGGISLFQILLCYWCYSSPVEIPVFALPTPLTAMEQTSADKDAASFLRFYGPIASPVQHVFFLFTSLALLGACDKLAKDKSNNWNKSNLWQPVFDFIVLFGIGIICHFLQYSLCDKFCFQFGVCPY